MLFLDLRVGDQLQVGDAIISLLDKSGKRARIQVDADRNIAVNLVRSTTFHPGCSAPDPVQSERMSALTPEVSTHGPHHRRPQ